MVPYSYPEYSKPLEANMLFIYIPFKPKVRLYLLAKSVSMHPV